MIQHIPRRAMHALFQSPRHFAAFKMSNNYRLRLPVQVHTCQQGRRVISVNQSNRQIPLTASSPLFITRSFTSSARLRNENSTPVNAADIPYIPEVPTLEMDPSLNALGESTLTSLGLCGWWPSGWVQSLLETLHVTADLDWWQAIVIYAIGLRIVTFPLMILAKKYQNEQMPLVTEYGKLNQQLERAQADNERVQAVLKSAELQKMKQDKSRQPSYHKLFAGPLYQVPVWFTSYTAVRQMCNVPVESMSTGGIAWFQDLLIPDPYIILPILTSVTLLINIELGTDGTKLNLLSKNMRNGVRAGVLLLPLFLMNRPNAICLYWCVSNILGMVLMRIVSTPRFQNLLGIPEPKPAPRLHEKNKPPSTNLYENLKQKWKSTRSRRNVNFELENAKLFEEAAKKKPTKTYKHDPTQVKTSS